MKKIKATIHNDGTFELEPIEGFSGTLCTKEISKLVLSVGGSIIKEEKKPEYYDPSNEENIFVRNN